MDSYNPSEIEPKWQKIWRDTQLDKVNLNKSEDKFYLLVEFTYPSGDLHMGHWFAFAIPDILARKKRMEGRNVFYPNGFDAFGLPAENAAINKNVHPREWTLSNIKRMKEQFSTMGAIFDFEHEVITCDVDYYRWNQWIFLKMFEKGLAYRGKAFANWCPKDKCVLANENVENGRCWRCQTEVVQKEVEQWFLKITNYADKLLWPSYAISDAKAMKIEKASDAKKDKPDVDWPKPLIDAQNNWIGKSEGAEIVFTVNSQQSTVNKIKVFTTRPDTLYGATFLVLAPEHPVLASLLESRFKSSARFAGQESQESRVEEIREYIKRSQRRSELVRKENKDKTGVFTGLFAINPVNGKKIPIWVADYVSMNYGTGAIMAVPAHDARDFEFAKKCKLEVRKVISGENAESKLDGAYEGEGKIINSGDWNGFKVPESIPKIVDWLERKHLGQRQINYHLHDWSISRQRYWGTPIPIIYCDNCGTVPVPEKDLPVELPYEVDWSPKGKAPLATAPDSWLRVKCPNCGRNAKREVETMDTFVDSSWYFLRYLDPRNEREIASSELLKHWMPVDIYFGGAEHTLGHTLYSRFFVKFLNDIGVVLFSEYAKKRVHHGVILGPDGSRMSKSKGNVVNPDEEVKKYGADAVRIYLAFLGPYDLVAPWNPSGINGIHNFLQRVWRLVEGYVGGLDGRMVGKRENLHIMHRTIQKVTDDIEKYKFNTAVSALMEWLNFLEKKIVDSQELRVNSSELTVHSMKDEKPSTVNRQPITLQEMETFLLLLAPFAPHMTEELWQKIGSRKSEIGNRKFDSIHAQPWPKFDAKLATTNEIELVIQVNGKVRDKVVVRRGISQKEAESLALKSEKSRKYLGEKGYKVIFVPDKLVNFVVR